MRLSRHASALAVASACALSASTAARASNSGVCCTAGACAAPTSEATCSASAFCPAAAGAWLCDGDVDGNGVVGIQDHALVVAGIGGTDCVLDLNCDGAVSCLDVQYVASRFGTCGAPLLCSGVFSELATTCTPAPCAEVLGTVGDCQPDGGLDDCDIEVAASLDCNANLEPDECEVADIAGADCDANAVPDDCDISTGGADDCNANGLPDAWETAGGYEFEKFTRFGAATEERFGWSVALDGDALIVGGYCPDGPFTGSCTGSEAGKGWATVYRRHGVRWLREAALRPANIGTDWHFGYGVALDGDAAAITAPGDSSVYVFRHGGGSWSQEARLTASDGTPSDRFGASVAIDGDRVVVGADQRDNAGHLYSGAAYVFRNDGGTWTEEAQLLGDAETTAYLGRSVDIYGDRLIVGTKFGAAAYVYRREGTSWSREAKLEPLVGGGFDEFGVVVGLTDDWALVGAPGYSGSKINGGAVWAYRRIGLTWHSTALLEASDVHEQLSFGRRLAVDADELVVGAPRGLDGSTEVGTLYRLRRQALTWKEIEKLQRGDPGEDDLFGSALAMSGDRIAAGSLLDDDLGDDSGSAYVFAAGVPDCNGNGTPDSCDIGSGASTDVDGGGVPDECETALPDPGDFDSDGDVDAFDDAIFQACYAGPGNPILPECELAGVDADSDGDCDCADRAVMVAAWTGASTGPPLHVPCEGTVPALPSWGLPVVAAALAAVAAARARRADRARV